MKDVQPAMPGITCFSKHKSLFMPREKHSHRVGSCRVWHSIDPDCDMTGVNHYQLEVALTARTKGSTRGIGDFTDAHLFRPEAFTGVCFAYPLKGTRGCQRVCVTSWLSISSI